VRLARDDDQGQREQRDRVQPIVAQEVDADDQRESCGEDVRDGQATAEDGLANPDLTVVGPSMIGRSVARPRERRKILVLASRGRSSAVAVRASVAMQPPGL